MSTSRRKFLKLSALASGSVGLGLVPGMSALSNSVSSSGRAPKPLRILILGGTGFTGHSRCNTRSVAGTKSRCSIAARRIRANCQRKPSN